MEYDLVDSNDKYVRTGTKEDAKKSELFTRSVHIWIMNPKGELMICKRSSSKKSYPNMYTSSAGGHVDEGENYHDAAERELKEELGISIPIKDVGRFDVVSLRERAIHHLFIGTTDQHDFIVDKEEISEFSFLSMELIKEDVKKCPEKYARPFLEALKLYLKS